MNILYLAAFLPGLLHAETVSVTTTYMTRDDDSKSMAHNACILAAERMAVSRTAAFLEAETIVTSHDVAGSVSTDAKEWTRSSVATVVHSDVASEAYTPNGNLTCTVTVTYDPTKMVPVSLAARPAAANGVDKLTARASMVPLGMMAQDVVDYMGEMPAGCRVLAGCPFFHYGRAVIEMNGYGVVVRVSGWAEAR